MIPVHPTYNLRRYDRADDAGYAAELRSELYGDTYAVVDTGLGYAAVRLADISRYQIAPWRVLGTRSPQPDVVSRRERINAIVHAVTSERVAS